MCPPNAVQLPDEEVAYRSSSAGVSSPGRTALAGVLDRASRRYADQYPGVGLVVGRITDVADRFGHDPPLIGYDEPLVHRRHGRL